MASFYTNEGDHHMLPPNEYLLHQNQKLSSYHFEQFNNPQFNHHGLSLSLGSQEPVHFNPYDNSRLFSLLNSGGPHLSQSSGFSLCNSKYLEAARDLLDELVSVHRVSTGVVRDSDSLSRVDAGPSEAQEPSSNELSLHELQDKLTKLVSMLDEVERRYQQYRHQMRQLASSFDASAGPGASPPYTSLALRTISCQFRGLKDSIKKQIFSVQKRIGGDSNVGKGVIARLRYVDQQLRQQQKSVHQFGVMRQAWRPQRGLPENAVSVLRAWLFEHFLHPYPKDSEKVVLARETGLTRNQVANWFINARVRLWKPMIEEMYKEEFGFAETKLESSPEHTTNQTEFQETLVSSSRGMNDSFQSDFRLDHMQTNHNFVQEKSDEGAMKTQVTLALGLQRSENCPDGIQPTRNEYFYADNNSNLLPADFVV